VVRQSYGWVLNDKNIKFSETFLSVGLCRAFFADHFAKKIFSVWAINNSTKVKIPKNILPVLVGIV
jgi:hypothetical protein